jgi:hypothetical protein
MWIGIEAEVEKEIFLDEEEERADLRSCCFCVLIVGAAIARAKDNDDDDVMLFSVSRFFLSMCVYVYINKRVKRW